MSTTFEKRPVVHLNHDLLYHILQMNADMFVDHNALKTIRMASQVCRHWRDDILSMASLWAKLIDLSSLHRASDLWRDDLMRRSGTSLLWIATPTSIIRGDSTGIVSFLSSVINKNWHRIQKLVVSIEIYMKSPPQWTALYLPAPNLRTFDFCFCDRLTGRVDEEYAIGTLFSNNAPLLREYHSRRYRFDPNASWLQQLHLMEYDSGLTLNELLDALTAASNLKHLRLDGLYVEKVSPPPPIVSMPNLLSMTLFSHLEPGAILLEHLDLPPGCALKFRFRTEVDDYSELEDIYCPAMIKLSTLAGNVFRSRAPQMILLSCSSHEIVFQDRTEAGDPGFDFNLYFKYSLEEGPLFYAHRVFLSEFTLPELSEVTEIHLRSLQYRSMTLFTAFLQGLPSIENISTSNQSLSNEISQITNRFLPQLEFFVEDATDSE